MRGRARGGFGQRAWTVTEARGDDNRGGDAFGAGGGDEARHLRRRCGDDDNIRCVGQVRNAFDRGDAFNLAVVRIDELNLNQSHKIRSPY